VQSREYARERDRTALEKYSYRRIGTAWLLVPALISLCGLAYVAIAIGTKTPLDRWALVFLAPFAAAFLMVINCDDSRNERLRHKQVVRRDNPTYRFLLAPEAYEHTTFTDNPLEYFGYIVSKGVCYAASVAVLGMATVLGFMWLGSITIAPTTVIIILLLIIIYNQERARK
jgi:hypothetical protein